MLALPALAVPVNSVGVVVLLWCSEHSLVLGSAPVGASMAVDLNELPPVSRRLENHGLWECTGFSGNCDQSKFASPMVDTCHLVQYWPGIPDHRLRWISKPLRDPVSALVLASVVGLLGFFLLVQFSNGQEVYGTIFLQCLLSIFAFSGSVWILAWRSNAPN